MYKTHKQIGIVGHVELLLFIGAVDGGQDIMCGDKQPSAPQDSQHERFVKTKSRSLQVAHLRGRRLGRSFLPFRRAVSQHLLLFVFQTGIRCFGFLLGKFIEVEYLHDDGTGPFRQ